MQNLGVKFQSEVFKEVELLVNFFQAIIFFKWVKV